MCEVEDGDDFSLSPHPHAVRETTPMAPLHSLATLLLASTTALALSAHSPRDLESHPAFSVGWGKEVLKETVSTLLAEQLEVRTVPRIPLRDDELTPPPHADSTSRFTPETTPPTIRERSGVPLYRTFGHGRVQEAGGGAGGQECARSGGREGERGAARAGAA